MSSFPFRFLASWQAKQFSLRIGATSLMKLTGCAAEAGAWAEVVAADGRSRLTAATSTQQQVREGNILGITPERHGAASQGVRRREKAGGLQTVAHYMGRLQPEARE